MTPAQLQLLLVVLFWVILVPTVAFTLRTACGICQADLPTYRRAAVIVLVVGLAAYLGFDLTAYAIAKATSDVGPALPPGFTYLNWLPQPLPSKWQAIGLVPGVRYLPIVVGLCAAGVFQVLLLKVTFRVGLLIFAIEWVANVIAFAVLSFALTVTGGYLAQWFPPRPGGPGVASAASRDHRASRGRESPEARRGGQRARSGAAPTARARTAEKVTPDQPPSADPAAESPGDEAGPLARKGEEWLWHLRDRLDPYLDPVRQELEPVTSQLPEPARWFLDEGGWWLVFALLGLVALLWLRSTLKRLRRAVFRRRRPRHKRPALNRFHVDLRELAEAYTDPGVVRVAVRGVPCRVRLVVMAPAGKDTDVDEHMVDDLFDWIRPGLAEAASCDYPRVRVWPPQYSAEGFQKVFRQNVPIPDDQGERSRWVLLAGTVGAGAQKVRLGLGLYADRPNNFGHLALRPNQWASELGIQPQAAPTAGRWRG